MDEGEKKNCQIKMNQKGNSRIRKSNKKYTFLDSKNKCNVCGFESLADPMERQLSE